VIGQDSNELLLVFGLEQIFTVPPGSLANASSVGANTVKGPGPLRVSTRPAALTAVTSVLNELAATAVSTISAAFATEKDSASATAPAVQGLHRIH
jgi:hypothetical protein